MTAPVPLHDYWLRRRWAKAAAEEETAFQRGYFAGLRFAEAEHKQALAALKSDADTRLADMRQEWVRQEGELLAAMVSSAMGEMQAALGDALGAVLQPFLEEAVRDRALVEFRDALETVLRNRKAASLTVSCPLDLADALKGRLPDTLDVRFVDSPSVEVKAEVSGTVIETCFRDWMKAWEGSADAR
jgi:hypothetical protein